MTEREGELLHRVTEAYWVAFSKLVARHLDRVPPHLQGDLLMRLQEHSSVYGSAYAQYLKPRT